MPLIGYYGGVLVEKIISRYDHWIALLLLAFIGIKMIWESFKKEEAECAIEEKDPSRKFSLVMLSIATSIDAAAVGFSFAALKIPTVIPAIIIGIVCVLFSTLGLFIGNKIGSVIGKWAERFGGLILVAIGVKILLEHIG
jgi:manganese efflux pump family protein